MRTGVAVMMASAVLATAGCGRLSFEEVARDGGAALDAAAAPDAATLCDPTATFGAPVAIDELNTTADDVVLRLSPDERVGYFYSTRTGTDAIFVATRGDRAQPWGTPFAITGVAGATGEEDPTISTDGTTLAFRSTRAGGLGGSDIYTATRTTSVAAFDAVAIVNAVSSTQGDVQPLLAADDSALYLASNRPAGADYDLYVAPITTFGSASTIGTPAIIAELSSAADDEAPVIADDDRTIYFSSARAGGIGGRDIWVAHRATPAATWDAPVIVPELNSTSDDSPSWLSPDNCRLYLTAHRTGSDADLYVATRAP